jgi:5-methylthioribose kinase
MHEITPANAVTYLHEAGCLARGINAEVAALAWGVSNVVLRVTPAEGSPFVVKQSRKQLRTKDPWFSRLDRIWRETDTMRLLQPLLPAGVVPRVLFEDRENFLFAMEAAPADHFVWKQLLLDGQADASIASQLGSHLAAIHRETAHRPELARRFGDREVFVQLRVDPFYRRVAAACPEVQHQIAQMIDEMFATPVCLVHADFSPKNVLVTGRQLVLVDFETGHYGDPAFDLGFFLSHLLLKTVRHAQRFEEYAGLTTTFWSSYLSGIQPLAKSSPFDPHELHRRTTAHLAGCMWARIDGTSTIDYLHDEADHWRVRDFCRALYEAPATDWQEVILRLREIIRQ